MKIKALTVSPRAWAMAALLGVVAVQTVAQPNQPGAVVAPQVGKPLTSESRGSSTYSKTVTDQLMAVLLEKHLPAPLYEQGSNPWPGGDYKLEVTKIGRPEVTSAIADIHVKMPLRISIAGNVANDLLQVKLNCSTSFTTVGEILFKPTQPGVINSLASTVTLPIPAVMADCDGMQLPVDEYLKTVVAQNKRQWELKLDTEIKSWLAK